MAQRRMFSLQIVDTDAFMDMPLSAQSLYFHLGMRADDDGFVGKPKRVQKLIGAADDDMKILLMKGFIISFPSGVVVITHWKISNYIQKDRYRPTIYKEEKSTLFQTSDGAYTFNPPAEVPEIDAPDDGSEENPITEPFLEDVSNMDTDCIHRLGKVRLGKVRLGKVRLGKVSLNISGDDADTRACASAEEQVKQFTIERNSDPRQYFGVDSSMEDEVNEFTAALFRQWTKRIPTQSDVSNVFLAIRHTEQIDGKWVTTFPKDAKDLLMYAFEQSVMAGAAGDWFYIRGVLTNLKQRGITNLEQAGQYDAERDMRKDGVWNG